MNKDDIEANVRAVNNATWRGNGIGRFVSDPEDALQIAEALSRENYDVETKVTRDYEGRPTNYVHAQPRR